MRRRERFSFFTESVIRSKRLFLRNSRRKTATHFSWACSGWCVNQSKPRPASAAFAAAGSGAPARHKCGWLCRR
ncbi:MAG: hypothetical protein E5V92_19830 [Mesorhizobium sp.]|nr:hypothetical protein EJ067_14040 [Mesorhizobium sp. M1D.F.Ca.ET.043.01.1.1]RWA94923.1 MAG: hypothetical protein EOQ32_10580 [Mesorhizobium sp.]RWE17635.1 MAG: hypothetical protein EOS61_02110 [Mesorhizobium sp.]TIV69913.1 MAG: hypothetical protein E5V89_16840 [Mesorhizobium sp.]TJW83102.1 MAG: hypothetical protein E5V92_19830 [Mesorhizobium sp.]